MVVGFQGFPYQINPTIFSGDPTSSSRDLTESKIRFQKLHHGGHAE